MQLEEKTIFEKYKSNITSDDSIFKLMGRIGARVL